MQSTTISQSAEGLARRAEPALPPPAAAPRQPSVLPPGGRGPAAQFVAEKRRQLAVGPRGPRPASTAAGLQVLTTPGLRAVPAQRNSPTRPATGALSQLHLDTSTSTLSLGSEGSLAGPAEGQHSAAENALFPDGPSGGNALAGTPLAQPQRDSGDAACCPTAGSLTAQAADAVLVGHGEMRAGLRARVGRLKEVRVLMARGDSRGVAAAVRAYQGGWESVGCSCTHARVEAPVCRRITSSTPSAPPASCFSALWYVSLRGCARRGRDAECPELA